MKRKKIEGIIKKIEVALDIPNHLDWRYHGYLSNNHPRYTFPINIIIYAITGRKDRIRLGKIEDYIEGVTAFNYYFSDIIIPGPGEDPEWKLRRYRRYSRGFLGKRVSYYKNPEEDRIRDYLLPRGENELIDEEKSQIILIHKNGRLKGGKE